MRPELFFLTVIPNAAAILLMAVLLGKSKEYYEKKNTEGGYFRYFLWTVIGMACISILWAVGRTFYPFDINEGIQDLSSAEVVKRALLVTIDVTYIFLTTVFLFLWLVYVAWRLYHNRDYLKRQFRIAVTPLLISCGIAVFSWIMAFFTGEGVTVTMILLFAFLGIRSFYFIISILRLRLYKKQNGYMKFFNLPGFYIPVITGFLISDFTLLEYRALGAAIGILFLYASITREQFYQDRETGLYSIHYRDYLKKLITKGDYAPCSAMVFTVPEGGDIVALSGVLKKQLPKDSEAIRRKENEIVVLTQVKEKAPLFMVMEDIRAAAETDASCILKKKKETPAEFMERVL